MIEVNGNGTMVDEKAVLSQIVRLVEEAQNVRAANEAFADYVSENFVPTVVTISVDVFCIGYLADMYDKFLASWCATDSMFFFALLFALQILFI